MTNDNCQISNDKSNVLLFFIDGLGVGTRGSHNPFDGLEDAAPLAIFQDESTLLPFDGVLAPTDACMGVAGRPQSAAGQTTIRTGTNAPAGGGDQKQGCPKQGGPDTAREHAICV